MTTTTTAAIKNCYSVAGGPPSNVPTNCGSVAGHHLAPPRDNEELMAEESWQTFLTELDHYVEQHGHAHVPQTTTTRTVNGKPYPLGRKVNETRYRYRAGALTQDRIAQLRERPGWAWNADAARWQQKLQKTREYHHQHQSLNGVPTALRQWILRQRWAAEAGELTPEQVQQMQAVPGILNTEPLDDFLEAAHQWLQQNPGKTIANLQGRTTVTTPKHPAFPIGKRAIYYRRRRAALEGTHPLTDNDATRIEQLPGWSWSGTRVSYDET